MSAVLKAKPSTIGGTIDNLFKLRESKRGLEAEIKTIEEKMRPLEEELMTLMDGQGVDKSAGKLASVSIGSATSFNIDDFDKFAAYVKKTGYFHLFHRRVSDLAARELYETKGAVPGLSPFTKRKLNLRTIS